MIYEYKCTKCGLVQEKWHKLSEINKESCSSKECNAESKLLDRVISPLKTKHGTWSRWKIGHAD